MLWQEIPMLEKTQYRYYRAPDGRVAVLGGNGPPPKDAREALWVDRRRPLRVNLDAGRVHVPLWTEGAMNLDTLEPLRCAIELARQLGLALLVRVGGRAYVVRGDGLRELAA